MDRQTTIEQRMRAAAAELTPAERQAASHILSHFPMSALGSITSLARAARVSSPTIVRLVQKLGYKGYSDYQAALRAEVEGLLTAPLSLSDGARGAPAHPFQGFAAQVVSNIEATIGHISARDVTGAAALLADPARRIVVMGGRLTHAHADYMATLLGVARPDVLYLVDNLATWQQALLDLRIGDVAVIFDIRRYEGNAIQFAEMAARQGVEIVLITDRWISPAGMHARHILPCHVEMPATWDSTVAMMLVVEALLAQVEGLLAGQVQERLRRLEDMFASTRVFRTPRAGARGAE